MTGNVVQEASTPGSPAEPAHRREGKSGRPSHHLEVVQLARLRPRHEPRPVHRDALQRRGRVEGAALLEAQRAAVSPPPRAGARACGGLLVGPRPLKCRKRRQ